MNENDANPIVQLPLVCTRGVVVFPNQEVIIDVGREKSTRAVEEAQEKYESQVVLVAQRDLALEEPDVNDVFSYGTLCQIKHISRMDGYLRVKFRGIQRVELHTIINDDTLTIVYLSDDPYTRQYEVDLIKEMSPQRKGNKLMAVMNKRDDEVAGLVDYAFSFDLENEHENAFLGFDYIVAAQVLALFKSLSYDITPDNPCPTGEVNRVVKGVTLHPYTKR